MRLIDADELKKKLWSPTETYITENIVTEEEIDETSTAYDIDKVIEQLEVKFDRWGLDKGKKEIMREIVKGDATDE